MSLRTPRRRVSSRTKQRYRTIKKFIRKALGKTPQTGTNLPSHIELSVSDLKQKISCLETQLDKVSKHCREIESFHSSIYQKTNKTSRSEDVQSINKVNQNISATETKILYKARGKSKRSDESDNISKSIHSALINSMTTVKADIHHGSLEKDQHRYNKKIPKINKHGSLIQNESTFSKYATQDLTNNNNSITDDLKNVGKDDYNNRDRKRSKKPHPEPKVIKERRNKCGNTNDITIAAENYHGYSKRKYKREPSYIDEDFISHIINKQYKPVKLFNRRASDLSQMSAPVCRDKEFSICGKIGRDNDLCSCCFDRCKKRGYKNVYNSDTSDMKSVCDTRLYSSKKRHRYDFYNATINDYNNAAYYDIIPVKEKSSPKTRKKVVGENIAFRSYKEVPPSPRTQRPRFNLEAKAYIEDDYDESVQNKKSYQNCSALSDDTNSLKNQDNSNQNHMKECTLQPKQKRKFLYEDMTVKRSNYRKSSNGQYTVSNNDTTLNSHTTDSSVDKADKTLAEIRDILESFLTVIKKESVINENFNNTEPNDFDAEFANLQNTSKRQANTFADGQCFSNLSGGQQSPTPVIPVFPNTCCYPVMPVCPVNYLQNSYVLPSASHTCNMYPKATRDPKRSISTCNMQNNHDSSKDTQELIREIHKFVAQNPKSTNNNEYSFKTTASATCNQNKKPNINLVTRSVGGSTAVSEHGALYENQAERCSSKSCELIESKANSVTYDAKETYSDSVLEKLSIEATQSSNDTVLSNKSSVKEVKTNKFRSILKQWKLWGKKKKGIIEELSESESTIEVEIKRKVPPFKQHITNYAMHGQEFYNPPRIERYHDFEQPHFSRNRSYSRHDHYPRHYQRQDYNNAYHPRRSPVPPYYNCDPSYTQMSQLPLCLKEIEVKSIGTQSERKMSLLRKLTQKVKTQRDQAQQYNAPMPKEKPKLFDWKTIQENAKRNTDAGIFTLKTQAKLAQNDMNIRNTMIKKLFYKRNPFSSRNLIVRTLLGKDPSSYGNPPKFYKPRMFM